MGIISEWRRRREERRRGAVYKMVHAINTPDLSDDGPALLVTDIDPITGLILSQSVVDPAPTFTPSCDTPSPSFDSSPSPSFDSGPSCSFDSGNGGTF